MAATSENNGGGGFGIGAKPVGVYVIEAGDGQLEAGGRREQ